MCSGPITTYSIGGYDHDDRPGRAKWEWGRRLTRPKDRLKHMNKYEYHPAAQIFPLMAGEELKELAKDIKEHGLLEPITMIAGAVLDGRNRLMACKSAGIEPRFVEWDGSGGSPTLYVIGKNIHRRHLTISQRAAIGVEMLPLLRDEAKKRLKTSTGGAHPRPTVSLPEAVKGESTEIAGKAVGVGASTISHAKVVKAANPEAFERLKRGETTVSEEYEDTRETPRAKRPSAATDAWLAMRTNAQKRRMIDILSQMGGLAKGLPKLETEKIRLACEPKEITTWANKAFEIARALRDFRSRISQEEENGK